MTLNCQFQFVRQLEDGRFLLKCSQCGREVVSKYADPKQRKANCPKGQPPLIPLPAEVQAEVARQAESRGMLVGDMVAALTKAVGIPPCGGCEGRRQWLNRAHAWLRGDPT